MRDTGQHLVADVAPFRRHCRLPVLPGKAPLGGHILSHDQVEAVLMRRAGYEVQTMWTDDGIVFRLPDTDAAPDVDQLIPERCWYRGGAKRQRGSLCG